MFLGGGSAASDLFTPEYLFAPKIFLKKNGVLHQQVFVSPNRVLKLNIFEKKHTPLLSSVKESDKTTPSHITNKTPGGFSFLFGLRD